LFAPRIYIFVLRAHPVRGESHNQRNATGEVATQLLLWVDGLYLPLLLCAMVIFQFAIFEARGDQQEYINGAITAADFKGSLTVVHNGSPAEIVNNNSSEVEEQ